MNRLLLPSSILLMTAARAVQFSSTHAKAGTEVSDRLEKWLVRQEERNCSLIQLIHCVHRILGGRSSSIMIAMQAGRRAEASFVYHFSVLEPAS